MKAISLIEITNILIMKKVLSFIFFLIIFSCSKDDDSFYFKPKNQIEHFYTSDIDLFWQASDFIKPHFSKENFQKIYINNGTAGLKDYASQKQLANGLEQIYSNSAYRQYYSKIRANTQDLSEVISKTQDGFAHFKEFYPSLQQFDVYFLIGALGAGGRVSNNGLLIALEMFAKTSDLDIQGLNEWHRNVIQTKEYLPTIILHELVHKQQKLTPKSRTYKTLLEQTILEGMADYIACFIMAGKPFFNQHLHNFGDGKEEDIWKEFKQVMDKNYTETDWLYSGKPTTKGYPADIGYFVGYKITEAFFLQYENKADAINALLSISDYYSILSKSKYSDKFE